ncbi:hypothetical protein [Emticicia fontis]
MKHWTQYLPEGRRIFRDQVSMLALAEEKIKKLKWELASAQAMLLADEFSIRKEVEKQYSKDEIDAAITEFEKDKL